MLLYSILLTYQKGYLYFSDVILILSQIDAKNLRLIVLYSSAVLIRQVIIRLGTCFVKRGTNFKFLVHTV